MTDEADRGEFADAVAPMRGAFRDTRGLGLGDLGHKTVCEIAFQELNDKAKREVRRLIRIDPEFTTFADACTWPDHPRKRAAEHFIISPAQRASWTSTPVVAWANESFLIARMPTVQYCTRTAAACVYASGNEQFAEGETERVVTIDADYIAMHVPFVAARA